MEFRLFHRQCWVVPLLIKILLVTCVYPEITNEDSFDAKEPEHETAFVTHHTPVNKQRRSLSTFEQTEKYLEEYKLPEKMSFEIQARGHSLALNLTRNKYARAHIHMSDENGDIEHDLSSQIGVYYSIESNASVLVECQEGHCSLYGSLEIADDLFHIEQDSSSNDLKTHTIRRRELPSIEEQKKFLYGIIAEGDKSTTLAQVDRSRRWETVIPDCDIIEVQALVDDTIWEFYLERFGGNEPLAEAEIRKYFTSEYAEVDLRLKCLTSYFENIAGCGTPCLRVILVGIEITKTSSWTDGNLKTQSFSDGSVTTFVKGLNGLNKCGYLNTQRDNSRWDHLSCFTRTNIELNNLDLYRAVSWRPSMCNSNRRYRTSINEAKGDGVSAHVAHAILHALNAYNDEDKTCAPNEYFLMKEPSSKKSSNPGHWGQNWYLSGCTAKDICDYIGGLSHNCMRYSGSFDEESWMIWEDEPLPGELYTADQQCKDRWGNESVQCDPTGEGNLFPEYMCSRYIWCTLNYQCVCVTRLSSGTPCGKARTCQKARCLPTPNIPLGGTCDCHYQCVDDYAVCDPNTCTCVCVEGYYDSNGNDVDGGNCTEKVPNGGPCTMDRQCLDPRAVCINNTCQCPPCFFDYYGECVEESCIGDPCISTDQCKDDHAVCDYNRDICVCETGWFVSAEGKCVIANGSLCDLCIKDPDSCTQLDTECSDRGFCECADDTVAVEGECYGTKVGQRCTNVVNTCSDDGAICNGTYCVCGYGLTWNGTTCVGNNLCDRCDPMISTCECSLELYRCICPLNQVQIGDGCYGTRVTETCTTTINSCTDDNAICDGSLCICRPGFYWTGTICVGMNLCNPCDPITIKCNPPYVCNPNSNVCECPSDRVQIEGGCYGTRVNENCTNLFDTCIDNNAECAESACYCKLGYYWNGNICVGQNLCDPCDLYTDTCLSSFVCNPNTYRCECFPHQVQIGDGCYGTRVTEACTTTLDTCSDNHAECNGVLCECVIGFTWNNTDCVGTDLCDQCDPAIPCVLPFECNPDTYRCECHPSLVQIGNGCYGTHVNEDCTTSTDTCVDDNAECDGTVCSCVPGYFWNGSICVGPGLCDNCDPNQPSCGSDLVCSPYSYRCECPIGHVQIGDTCYGRHVTETCTSALDTCIDDNADCNGTICDCVAGFIWNNSICVGENLCDPCDPNFLSCGPQTVCSPYTYRCECPPNEVQIEDACYGTRVTEECTNVLNTCVDEHAECNGSVCICKTGFVWNGSFCVGQNLCDPCDPMASTCDPYMELVCNPDTYRCECPSDKVQYGDACYGTLVLEPCTLDLNTCVNDHAICNGTVCDCVPGYIWNGSNCVGSQLCDLCDSSVLVCEDPFVCGADSYVCECPPGNVQIENGCYGTHVTDVCTNTLDTCVDRYAECNGAICSCVAGFFWNGSKCVGENLCDPCDPLTLSCDSHLVCSPYTYRCECPSDQVQIGDNCYGTRVNESCTFALPTCVDFYAACDGTHCCCYPPYIWNGSICVGPSLCDPCDPLYPSCSAEYVCNPDTYRCECPVDRVQIKDMCYGTHVTDECTSILNTCTDHHAICDGSNCICEPGFAWNNSICVGQNLCDPCDPATLPCGSGLICSTDTHTCACPLDRVQIGNACYGTLVDEPCTLNLDSCVDDNAECNGAVCVCMSGFIWNNSICVGSDLCDQCDPLTPSCDSSLVCSPDTYRCECPPNRVQIDDGCYGTLLTEACTNVLNTCTDCNAECNGTVCDCLTGYIWNGSVCNGPGLCDQCDPDTPSCNDPLVCSADTYRCECPPDRVQIGGGCYGTLFAEPCITDTCIDDYAVCNGSECVCQPGFQWNGSRCVGPNLCDPCDPDSSSCSGSLVCSSDTYRCECPSDRVQIEDGCYGTLVTEVCTSILDTCVDKNAECNGTVCDCKYGFTWNDSLCVGTDLCDPCDPGLLSCGIGLVCSAITYRCECLPNHVQIGDGCFGTLVTEECTPTLSTCTDYNAECNGTICNCISGFIWNGSTCVGTNLCDPCDLATPCESGLVCSAITYRCECPPNRVQIGDDCFGTRVNDPCSQGLSTCIDDRAECNVSTCACKPGFTWDGFFCIGGDTGSYCTTDDQCTPPYECSNASICVCPSTFVQIGDNCYGRFVTEECTSALDTCKDCDAECNGTVCVCKAGFVWNGSICGGPNLCDQCDPLMSTCGQNLVCSSQTYRCECPPNQVQVGDMCYGTRVSEVCTSVIETCTDQYASCNGTVCNCVHGFTWNDTECVGFQLCDPCDPSIGCLGTLECSLDTYRCECMPGEVQIGYECFGRLFNEPCTTQLSTCIDDNAECNGANICDCMTPFTWNGSICVGTDIWHPCDPVDSTCNTPLVCSPYSFTCECPSTLVQIGEECYGTLFNESCTSVVNTCTDDHAVCNGVVCACVPGLVWNGSICVGPSICDPCDSTVLSCQSPLVCSSETYRCECPPDRVQVGDSCYGTHVNEPCTTSQNTCTDDNAACNGTICDCVLGFIWNGSICVGSDVCDLCDSSVLPCASPFECNADTYRCECPSDQVQFEDACYGTHVNESCTTSLNTCTDKYSECTGTTCECVTGFIWNGSRCVGPNLWDPCDPLALSCKPGLVCNSDTYRCDCLSTQVQIGDECYGTRIAESCTSSLDTCIDDGAMCNGSICDCMLGYSWNGSICAGSNLCDQCDPLYPTCDSGLVCSSETYRCECQPPYVQFGDKCYGTLVNQSCTSVLDTCIDRYADCNGMVCSCISGFTWNGSICLGPNLCDPCDTSIHWCASGLVCSADTYRCECPPGQVHIGNDCYGTLIGEQCTSDLNTCVNENAICNGSHCVCNAGFMWNESICVGPNLCDPCDPGTPSCHAFLACSPDTYRCECPSGQVQIGDHCYGTHVSDNCTTSLNTCIDDNADCDGSICSCMTGYNWTGSICVGSNLCDHCDPLTPSCGPGLECNTDINRCGCPADQVQIGDACYGTHVNDPCTILRDSCVDDNADCNGTVCECVSSYMWNGSICVGPNLCDPCDPATLPCASNFVCSTDSSRCECPPGEVQIGNACYGTEVSESCTTSLSTCIDKNAECNGTVCVCMPGFIWNDSICVGPNLCDPCDPLTPSCVAPIECSPDTYRCECPADRVQIGDTCFGTRVNEECTTMPNTCIDENAECGGAVCGCVIGFAWNGSDCVGENIWDLCDNSTLSCQSPLVCSVDSHRCECPSGQVQIGDSCYGTRVLESCTSNEDTCIDDNADCNGTLCVCNAGFIWTGSICVGPDLCDPCDPATPSCSSALTCSSTTNRCECPPDRVQIGDACYGTLLNESCTTSLDTCIDSNAECTGAYCDCLPGFAFNGSICVGSELCDPCDPYNNTCGYELVCSVETYRCECPPDEVQYGNACFGTRVSMPCTQLLDTCTDDYAECNGTICVCQAGFTWNESICVGSELCDLCDPSVECAAGLVCSSTTYRCECPAGQLQIGDACYGKRIGEVCISTTDTCIDDNAMCIGGFCDCIPPFTWNATLDFCVGVDIDDPCDFASCGSGLVCGVASQRCECDVPLAVQIDNVCYGSEVGEVCTVSQDTCTDYNAECSLGNCSCIAGFFWNGVHCVGSQIDDPCDNSADSCIASGLVCGPTQRCECPDDEVQVDNMCYSLVCGQCTIDDDCLGNRICVDSICQCDANSYLDNCSICQPKMPNDGLCSSDEQCVSYICACGICVATLDEDCCGDCDDVKADVVVLTDNAESSTLVYQKVKNFAVTLTSALPVSPDGIQVGLVDFSDKTIVENSFTMSTYTQNSDITAKIYQNNYNGKKKRRTHRALRTARHYFESSDNRDEAPDYVVVILSGNSCCPANFEEEIALLKNVTGLTIYAVSVEGGVNQAQLEEIATEPSNVFLVADQTTLSTITMDILDNSCVEGSNIITPPVTTPVITTST